MYMFICIHLSMCVFVYILSLGERREIFTYKFVYRHMPTLSHVIHIYICTYIIHIHIYVYICIYVYVNVRIYTYTDGT